MKLVELCNKYEWDEVKDRFLELYPDQDKNIEGYECVFYLFHTLEEEDTEGMRLCIRHVDNADLCREGETPDEWEDVHGKNGELAKDFEGEPYLDDNGNTFEQTWALELSSFNYWASLEVEEETLSNYGPLDIVCHSLWEMTFCGFSQEDIDEQKAELLRRKEEIDNGTAELIPWEEIKNKIEKELETVDATGESTPES